MHCNRDLFNKCGNILISDQFNNRVIEVSPRGELVWSFGLGPNNFTSSSIIGVNDAQRIGKNTLMAGTGIAANVITEAPTGAIDNRVILVNKCGDVIWQYGQFGLTGTSFNLLSIPVQCTFIPSKNNCEAKHKPLMNGTILITDQGNNRVIRVNEDKDIVWEYPGPNNNPGDQLNNPNSAQMIQCTRHILIADKDNNRAIEVNRNHEIVKIFTANGTMGTCAFASRLSNGNTLLTDAGNSRIVEVDENDNIMWQYYTNMEFNSIVLPTPTRALRLNNGDTIISDQFNNRVIKINETTTIMAYFGLQLIGGVNPIGDNNGYDLRTTQLGLYCPHDAKVIGDYTGITIPF